MIELPWPPTVNHYYTVARGRKSLSQEGRAYKAYACQLMMLQHTLKLEAESYCVTILARPPDRRKRDLDNIVKPVFDSLVEYGAIFDDSKIDDFRVQRLDPVKDGAIRIVISGIEK